MTEDNLIHILIHSIHLLLTGFLYTLWRRAVESSPRKVVSELLAYVDDLEARLDRNDGKWKKLNANYALILARGKVGGNGSSNSLEDGEETGDLDTALRAGEDGAAHKARLRRYMNAGRFRHGADTIPRGD